MNRLMFSTLKGRFMAIAISVITVLLVFKLVFQVSIYIGDVQREIDATLANTLSLGGTSLSLPYWNLDRQVMKSIASAILEDPNVVRVRVNNFHSLTEFIVDEEDYSFDKYSLVFGEGDIIYRDHTLGKLQIWITKEHYQKQLTKSIASVVAFSALEALFLLFALSKATERVTAPIKRLTESAELISKGNLEEKIIEESNDEIGILSLAFDSMRSQVKDHIQQLTKDQQEIRALYEEASALNETLEDLLDRLDGHYEETIRALANAIEVSDEYTKGHCDRVSRYALIIGKKLGLSSREMSVLSKAAILHDIGKIGVPHNILNKEGRLTNEEYDIIKNHSEIGYQILKDVEFLRDSATVIREHHERPDGKGYPKGLSAKSINTLSMIVGIADAYDAMTQARAYRKTPLSREQALIELMKYKGTQFSSEIVDVWVKTVIEEGDF